MTHLPYDIDDPALVRATWSRLAEPASAAATMLVDRLGPSAALRWLLEEATDAAGRVRGAPPPPVPEPPPAPRTLLRPVPTGRRSPLDGRLAWRGSTFAASSTCSIASEEASFSRETPGGRRGSMSWSTRPSACGCAVTRHCWSASGICQTSTGVVTAEAAGPAVSPKVGAVTWAQSALMEGPVPVSARRSPGAGARPCASSGCRRDLPTGCAWRS